MGEQSEKREESKGFVWTQEAVKDVEDFIEHLADKYLSYKKNETEADQRYFEAEARHNRNMVITLGCFLVVYCIRYELLDFERACLWRCSTISDWHYHGIFASFHSEVSLFGKRKRVTRTTHTLTPKKGIWKKKKRF